MDCMANPDHVERLKKSVPEWNYWRESNRDVSPDLSGALLAGAILTGADLSSANINEANLILGSLSAANLSGANLTGANFSGADLRGAILTTANLRKADLRGADLRGADLKGAILFEADLRRANLTEAVLYGAVLYGANLSRANLFGANLICANLTDAVLYGADLSGAKLGVARLFSTNLRAANLSGADLSRADLGGANLIGANLTGANLSRAVLIETRLDKANLTGCVVYGLSAWDVQLEGTIQADLVITKQDTHAITVDDLQIAQFIYLLLNNKNVRHVIDTITSKVVLILGRFTPERKSVLDAIREELRKRDYLPVLFDFEGPSNRDITETVSTLAHMARFVIADITDAKGIPQELMAIVPALPSVPVQPLLLASQQECGMFEHFKRFPWVLEPYLYEDQDRLLAAITDKVIGPAESKAKEQTGQQ